MFVRDTQDADLAECFDVDVNHAGSELVGSEKAVTAWKALLQSCAVHSVVVVANPPILGHRVVGFGASAFVTSEFFQREIDEPRPRLNDRLIESVDTGNSVVLSKSQIAYGNFETGLDLVVLCGCWRKGVLNKQQVQETWVLLSSAFLERHRGYRVNRVLSEVIGPEELEFVESGPPWQMVSSFEHSDPKGRLAGRRYLFMLSREQALSSAGSVMAILFQYEKPKLWLQDADQELLAAALGGLTDEELSTKLHLSVGAVKKRWLSLFDRIADRQPDLLGSSDAKVGKKRGRQKRNHVLEYIRQHPEELRPNIRQSTHQLTPVQPNEAGTGQRALRATKSA